MPKALVIADLVLAVLHAAYSGVELWLELSSYPLGLVPYRVTAEATAAVLAVAANVLILRGSAKGRDVAFAAILAIGAASAFSVTMALTHSGCPPLSLANVLAEVGLRLAYNGVYLFFLLRAGRGRPGAPRVFISYRHHDAQFAAEAIREQLVRNLGHGRVFIDHADLSIGEDFANKLLDEAGSTDALLVLITPPWSRLLDQDGRRRLDDPSDFVVREVAAGLAGGALVVPLLLEGAKMPAPDQLPTPIRALAGLHGVALKSSQLQDDVRSLSRKLRSRLPPDPQARAAGFALGLGAALLLGALAAFVLPTRPTGTAVLKTQTGKVAATSDGSCRGEPRLTVPAPGDEIHRIHLQVQNLQSVPLSVLQHDVVSLLDGEPILGYKYKPPAPLTIAPNETVRLVVAHDTPIFDRARDHVDRFDTDGCGATQAVRITTSEGVLPLVTINGIHVPCGENE